MKHSHSACPFLLSSQCKACISCIGTLLTGLVVAGTLPHVPSVCHEWHDCCHTAVAGPWFCVKVFEKTLAVRN